VATACSKGENVMSENRCGQAAEYRTDSDAVSMKTKTHHCLPLAQTILRRNTSTDSQGISLFYATSSSSPCSQQPATCPYHEPNYAVCALPSKVSEIHFNIILPSTPMFPCGPSRIPTEPCTYSSSFPHTYVPQALPILSSLTF
jgi:hypothetical protein